MTWHEELSSEKWDMVVSLHDRWEQKGGGRKCIENKNIHLDKWLWRSVWDFYIASCF